MKIKLVPEWTKRLMDDNLDHSKYARFLFYFGFLVSKLPILFIFIFLIRYGQSLLQGTVSLQYSPLLVGAFITAFVLALLVTVFSKKETKIYWINSMFADVFFLVFTMYVAFIPLMIIHPAVSTSLTTLIN